MSIVADNDNGHGPHLHCNHGDWITRRVHNTRVQELKEVIEGNGGRQPFSINHYISIAIDPAAINLESLTYSLKRDDHGRVQWNEGYANRRNLAFLTDGHHRRAYLERCVLHNLFQIRNFTLERQGAMPENNDEDIILKNSVTRALDELDGTIVNQSLWLVQFFNASMYI